MEVRGICATKRNASGSQYFAKCCSRWARQLLRLVAVCPGLSTTAASGRSSHFGWRAAKTAASSTAGCAISAFSSATRADPLAAGLDDVLRAVGDAHVALGVDGHDVAGLEPAVLREAVLALVAEVRRRDPRAAHLELAHRLAVPGRGPCRSSLDVALLDERAPRSPARRAARASARRRPRPRGAASRRASVPSGFVSVMPHACVTVEAVALDEAVDQRGRRRRAADDHRAHRREVPALRLLVEQRPGCRARWWARRRRG